MKATQIRDKIFAISRSLHELSHSIAEIDEKIELDGLDFGYLESKVKGDIINVSNHIYNQLKHKQK